MRLEAETGQLLSFTLDETDRALTEVRIEPSGRAGVAQKANGGLVVFRGAERGAEQPFIAQILTEEPVRLFDIGSDLQVHYVTVDNRFATFSPIEPLPMLTTDSLPPTVGTVTSQGQIGSVQTQVQGDAPSFAFGNLVAAYGNEISEDVHEYLTAQEQQNVDYETATNLGVATLFSGNDYGTTSPAPHVDALAIDPSTQTIRELLIAIPPTTLDLEVESDGPYVVLGLGLSDGAQVLRYRTDRL